MLKGLHFAPLFASVGDVAQRCLPGHPLYARKITVISAEGVAVRPKQYHVNYVRTYQSEFRQDVQLSVRDDRGNVTILESLDAINNCLSTSWYALVENNDEPI